jgi:hypothetical protein
MFGIDSFLKQDFGCWLSFAPGHHLTGGLYYPVIMKHSFPVSDKADIIFLSGIKHEFRSVVIHL